MGYLDGKDDQSNYEYGSNDAAPEGYDNAAQQGGDAGGNAQAPAAANDSGYSDAAPDSPYGGGYGDDGELNGMPSAQPRRFGAPLAVVSCLIVVALVVVGAMTLGRHKQTGPQPNAQVDGKAAEDTKLAPIVASQDVAEIGNLSAVAGNAADTAWFRDAALDGSRPPQPSVDGKRLVVALQKGSLEGFILCELRDQAYQPVQSLGVYTFNDSCEARWCGPDAVMIRSVPNKKPRVDYITLATGTRKQAPAKQWGAPSHNGRLIANYDLGGETFCPTALEPPNTYGAAANLVVYDRQSGKTLKQAIKPYIMTYCLAWSPDDQRLACWAPALEEGDPAKIAVYNVGAGSLANPKIISGIPTGCHPTFGWQDNTHLLILNHLSNSDTQSHDPVEVYAADVNSGTVAKIAMSNDLPAAIKHDIPVVWVDGGVVYPSSSPYARFAYYDAVNRRVSKCVPNSGVHEGSLFSLVANGVWALRLAADSSVQWKLAGWTH